MPNTSRPWTFAQLEELWVQAGGDRASAAIMAAIALAESSGNPLAKNDQNTDHTIDRGLWQINSSNVDSPSMFDPMSNAREAVKLRNNSLGLRNWTTYTSGKYRQFLSNARPDPNLPTGSTNTATQSGFNPLDPLGITDAGGAIGEGLAKGLTALFEPFLASVIWGSEMMFGIGLMVLALFVFAMATDVGRRATGAVVGAAGGAAKAVAPEVGIPVAGIARKPLISQEQKVQIEQRRQAERAAVRHEAARRNRGNSRPGNSES